MAPAVRHESLPRLPRLPRPLRERRNGGGGVVRTSGATETLDPFYSPPPPHPISVHQEKGFFIEDIVLHGIEGSVPTSILWEEDNPPKNLRETGWKIKQAHSGSRPRGPDLVDTDAF